MHRARATNAVTSFVLTFDVGNLSRPLLIGGGVRAGS